MTIGTPQADGGPLGVGPSIQLGSIKSSILDPTLKSFQSLETQIGSLVKELEGHNGTLSGATAVVMGQANETSTAGEEFLQKSAEMINDGIGSTIDTIASQAEKEELFKPETEELIESLIISISDKQSFQDPKVNKIIKDIVNDCMPNGDLLNKFQQRVLDDVGQDKKVALSAACNEVICGSWFNNPQNKVAGILEKFLTRDRVEHMTDWAVQTYFKKVEDEVKNYPTALQDKIIDEAIKQLSKKRPTDPVPEPLKGSEANSFLNEVTQELKDPKKTGQEIAEFLKSKVKAAINSPELLNTLVKYARDYDKDPNVKKPFNHPVMGDVVSAAIVDHEFIKNQIDQFVNLAEETLNDPSLSDNKKIKIISNIKSELPLSAQAKFASVILFKVKNEFHTKLQNAFTKQQLSMLPAQQRKAVLRAQPSKTQLKNLDEKVKQQEEK